MHNKKPMIGIHQLNALELYLKELRECIEEAPIDFLGTADYNTQPEENAWNLKWRTAYMNAENEIKGIKSLL
jgi:hypothetical protein